MDGRGHYVLYMKAQWEGKEFALRPLNSEGKMEAAYISLAEHFKQQVRIFHVWNRCLYGGAVQTLSTGRVASVPTGMI